ncbi:hypothetical protein [Teredinibacter sp. KSP-S5-2]|uniref:hypothetical protein n=1 Tax=Teredinibacter sp. KSP-S5-2 TaxID=3034506 RepID=UPI0029350039|nr:hypothetical protein [Teredinibacter sp. KSP-S5-2]WNO07652.1 hypothetical protein P5V12_11690 [Teredinibacter sp. KSP-S5-2]
MRRILLGLAIVVIATGCSENNNPYMDDIQAAKEKTQQCLDELHAAISARNEAEMNRLTNDEQCMLANKAHARHVNQSKISPAIPPSNDPRQPATDSNHGTQISPVEIEAAKAKQNEEWEKEFRAMEFRDYYQLSKKCLTSMIERKTPRCAVVRSLINERYEAEEKTLLAEYQDKSLEEYAKAVCTGESRDDAKCEIALRASGKARQ